MIVVSTNEHFFNINVKKLENQQKQLMEEMFVCTALE